MKEHSLKALFRPAIRNNPASLFFFIIIIYLSNPLAESKQIQTGVKPLPMCGDLCRKASTRGDGKVGKKSVYVVPVVWP